VSHLRPANSPHRPAKIGAQCSTLCSSDKHNILAQSGITVSHAARTILTASIKLLLATYQADMRGFTN
jgi:hypothetical protein